LAYSVTNNTEAAVIVADLGIMIETDAPYELENNFELSTICSSTDLKELILDETLSIDGLTGIDGMAMLNLQSKPVMVGMELAWNEFKGFISEKENVGVYHDLGSRYHILAPGYPYYCFIKKGALESTDFENNFKATFDKTKVIRADGRTRVHATVCPEDMHPQFLGCGDAYSESLGRLSRDTIGTQLLFEMPVTANHEIIKDVALSDDCLIEDGSVVYTDAPFGSVVNVEIVHPGLGNACVRRFVKNVPLLGSNTVGVYFDTDAPGRMQAGLKLRIRIKNPAVDAPTPWYACGFIKAYFKYTCELERSLPE
jgi:hypothetical protein